MGHFYFVRHGQTIWNVENKICGATDIALTKKGHEQAMQTGEKILADKLEQMKSYIHHLCVQRIRQNTSLRSQEYRHAWSQD